MTYGLEYRCPECHRILWKHEGLGALKKYKKVPRPVCCGRKAKLSRITEDHCPSMICKLGAHSHCNCICGGRYHGVLKV